MKKSQQEIKVSRTACSWTRQRLSVNSTLPCKLHTLSVSQCVTQRTLLKHNTPHSNPPAPHSVRDCLHCRLGQ